MEIQETYEIKVGEVVEVKDRELRKKIEEMVRHDTEDLRDEINNAVSELKNAFIEKKYSEDELGAEVRYTVTLYNLIYYLKVVVRVFPKWNNKIAREEVIMNNKEFNIVDKDYPKERNVLGTEIIEKLSIYIEYAKALREIEKLKRENEKLKQTCRHDEEEEDY